MKLFSFLQTIGKGTKDQNPNQSKIRIFDTGIEESATSFFRTAYATCDVLFLGFQHEDIQRIYSDYYQLISSNCLTYICQPYLNWYHCLMSFIDFPT
jgi:hypothetical protein